MHFEERARIDTPEGVGVDLTLAGVGSRMLATILDTLIKFVAWIPLVWVLGLISGEGSVLLGVTALYAVFAFFFYDMAFELGWAGRTPGKRAMGLRVTSTSGAAVGFTASAVRNVLRLVDFLPLLYAVGLVSIGISSRNQRIGDVAAATLVVRERRSVELESQPLPTMQLPTGVDVTAVTEEQLALARRFLDRRASIDNRTRRKLADEVAATIRPVVAGPIATWDSERLIEAVVVAKSRSG